MKLYQLFYLPNQWYTAVFGGVAGLLAATIVDWVPVSGSQLWESALVGVLASVVFVASVAVVNLVARLWAGSWLADA
jgi:hypothetical protein